MILCEIYAVDDNASIDLFALIDAFNEPFIASNVHISNLKHVDCDHSCPGASHFYKFADDNLKLGLQ